LYDSIEKSILKLRAQKYETPPFYSQRRPTTTSHESIGLIPTPPKSVDTFSRFPSVKLMVTSKTFQRRLHHEDGTGTPRIPRQPHCG